jgi:ATP-dependent DNA helicase DinG
MTTDQPTVPGSPQGPGPSDVPALSLEILNECVRIITGRDDLEPRTGQVRLQADLAEAYGKTFANHQEIGGHAIGNAPTGCGKALDIDTPIPTPSGWKRMGDLVAGDQVFDENGEVCNVVVAHEIQHERPCYEVRFDDGSAIVADAEHLWATQSRALRRKHSQRRRGLENRSATSRARFARYNKLHALMVENAIAYPAPLHTIATVVETLKGLASRNQVRAAAALDHEHGCQNDDVVDITLILPRLVWDAAKQSQLANPVPPPFEIVTTDQMRVTMTGQGGSRNHAIGVAGALDLPDADLLIDPYVLGAWLGDGSSNNSGFTTDDQEMLDEFQNLGYYVKALKDRYRYSLHTTPEPVKSRHVDSFTRRLRTLGLIQNKHIPVTYLRASFDQRLAMLQGLVDTDGTIDSKSNRCEIALCDKRLIEDAHELVVSLGIKATLKVGPATITETDPATGVRTSRIVGTRYRLAFTTDLPVARLARKRNRLPETVRPTQKLRYVDSIEAVETRPVRCIGVDSKNNLFLAGPAMVPTHNSFSYLTTAAAMAHVTHQRTVVSTEMISLQTQLIDKDAPVVADACEKITGFRPKTAILKGWSNFACTSATVSAAEEFIESSKSTGLAELQDLRDRMREHVKTMPKNLPLSGGFKGARGRSAAPPSDREKAELIVWALDEAASLGEKRKDGTGDKNAYEGDLTDSFTWDAVSVSSADCIGASKCVFSAFCLPGKAREAAADADIIVTNHHLLAVQAATGAPVVVGSKRIGDVHHLVLDEAHGLPSIVRSQGSVEVSSRSIKRAARSITRVMQEDDPKVAEIVRKGEAIGDRVEMELDEWIARIKRGEEVFRLNEGDNPLNDTFMLIESFVNDARNLLKIVDKDPNPGTQMKARRVRNNLDLLLEGAKKISDHQTGTARWVETVRPHTKAADQRPYPSAKFTPVDVSGLLRQNLWTFEDREAADDEKDEVIKVLGKDGDSYTDQDTSAATPRLAVTVGALSATLPKGFAREMGLKAQLKQYESPFDDAYGASVLFVPSARPGSSDVHALSAPWATQKPKFDTGRHADWAVKYAVDLVDANGGAALVLAATATSGRMYADALRREAKGRWRVLSQWDGPALRKQVADWKADTNAVLVGTKSLFTGIDAAGETCSLVIIDRPARSRSNPVDDARVEMLVKNANMDRWAADRLTYVADAAALLEQGAGRLIRQVTDSGMVAVLDPRLLKTSPFAYNEMTRREYLGALHKFDNKIADLEKAKAWLREHRASFEKKAS